MEAASSMGRKFSVSAEVRSDEAMAWRRVERNGVEFGADELAAVCIEFFGGETRRVAIRSATTGAGRAIAAWRVQARVPGRGENGNRCR